MIIDRNKVKQKLIEKKLSESTEIVEAVEPQDAALIKQLTAVLADTMVFYFKAHSFHWNVEGINFAEHHEFFSKVYTTAFERLDPLAEYIRQFGDYAPSSLSQLINAADLKELNSKPDDVKAMFNTLKADNQIILVGLKAARRAAEASGYSDLANFLDEMIAESRKLNWMLESFLK
jgi:starvation-inducible DNA-binding protein